MKMEHAPGQQETARLQRPHSMYGWTGVASGPCPESASLTLFEISKEERERLAAAVVDFEDLYPSVRNDLKRQKRWKETGDVAGFSGLTLSVRDLHFEPSGRGLLYPEDMHPSAGYDRSELIEYLEEEKDRVRGMLAEANARGVVQVTDLDHAFPPPLYPTNFQRTDMSKTFTSAQYSGQKKNNKRRNRKNNQKKRQAHKRESQDEAPEDL